MVRISAVAGSPRATAAITCRADASVAPPPPKALGATSPMRPCDCSASKFCAGKAPLRSWSAAVLAKRAVRLASSAASGRPEESREFRPAADRRRGMALMVPAR